MMSSPSYFMAHAVVLSCGFHQSPLETSIPYPVKGSLRHLVGWYSHRPLFSCCTVDSIDSSAEISLHMGAYGFRVLCSDLYGNLGFLHPGVCFNRPLYVGPRTFFSASLPFCVPEGAALHSSHSHTPQALLGTPLETTDYPEVLTAQKAG